jgi:hypothetical protein
MNNSIQMFVRAHIERKTDAKKPKQHGARRNNVEPKWPSHALIIDCETTIDKSQALTFGFYRFCRFEKDNTYHCREEGIFVADDIFVSKPETMALLKNYAASNQAETEKNCPPKLSLLSRTQFIEAIFWPALLNACALVVCFNAPFDLSRLAIECREAKRRSEGWSFIMSEDTSPKTGLPRENPFRPRIRITPRDGKSAFIRLTGVGIRSKTGGKRIKPYNPGRLLDLRTLGWALRSQSYSLKTACAAFGVPGKLDHEPTGMITVDGVQYCRQDVRATTSVLGAMRVEYELHPIDLHPDRAFSPASFAKAYLTAMGITPPLLKFKVPEWVHGVAMQAYYGGRAECRIRRTKMPVVYLDFLSEYTTVNTLLGLWSFLTADSIGIKDATEQTKQLLAGFEMAMVFDPSFWRRLCFFAKVIPDGDVLPVRTEYNGKDTNIGINPLTSEEPIWYAGPDLVASMILTGRPPRIVEAIRVTPNGKQAGMKPVRLRGAIRIDPSNDDFFKSIIEARARAKADPTLPESVRDDLCYFLKIFASAGSYGLFVEVNPEPVGPGDREHVRVSSGHSQFDTTTEVLEKPGAWYFPIVAALITSGGRLLLAGLEGCVTKAGGNHLLCDTDSMAVVACESGGLVPCKGGPFQTADGCEAIRALSFAEVETIVSRFDQLSPYDRDAVQRSILKIEDINCAEGKQRELFGYAIAAKRYALFTHKSDNLLVVAPKAHGLGFLCEPKRGFDSEAKVPIWVVEAWNWLLREALHLDNDDPAWFNLPAMMRFKITTPNVLKALQSREAHLDYRVRVKPFNFIQSPLIQEIGGCPVNADRNQFTLIQSWQSDTANWYEGWYLNIHDGKLYRLGGPGSRKASEAEPKTYGDYLRQYQWHPEAKSLAPDGSSCSRKTEGLLRRMPVVATSLGYIGKESDRRWEQGEDMSLLESKVQEYRPNETDRLATDQALQHDAKQVSIRKLAKDAGVSQNTVKAARRGERLQKAKIEALLNALKAMAKKTR